MIETRKEAEVGPSFFVKNSKKYFSRKIQERAFEEQLEIFGDDSECDVTQEQLSQMKYLEACVKEALRQVA